MKEVILTPQEDQLCTLLDGCVTKALQDNPESEPIQCRIAGGWVRDKV